MSEVNVEKKAQELASVPPDTDYNDLPGRNEILYERSQPGTWAKIGIKALSLAKDPVVQILCIIVAIDGLRRLEKLCIAEVEVLLDEAEEQISELDDDCPQKNRLIDLKLYHSGMTYYLIGEFERAAECHARSAKIAHEDGDERSAHLSNHSAELQLLNAAINKNCGIDTAYAGFVGACDALLPHIDTDSDGDIRWRANVEYNRQFRGWLVCGTVPEPDKLEIPRGMDEEFAGALTVLRAIRELEGPEITDPSGAIEIIGQGPTLEQDAGSYSLGMVIHAVALGRLSQKQEALAKFEEVLELEQPGTYLAKAIARCELKQLIL